MRVELVKETQKAFNAILGTDLVADGIFGAKTEAASFRFASQLLRILEDKDYKVEKLNFGGIRCTNKYTNKFSDYFYFYNTGGWRYSDKYTDSVYLIPASTLPGIYGLGAILNPKWIAGKFGTAVLLPGQYIDCYTLHNYENGWSGAPFLMQTGNMTIGRDGNKDMNVDWQDASGRNVIETGDWMGINVHTWKDWFSGILSLMNTKGGVSLSLGCQVYQYGFKGIVSVLLSRVSESKINKKISYTLLEIKDFT